MSHRATRGVCIGVDRHLKTGDPVPGDVDADTLKFLSSIGAVKLVSDGANIPDPIQDEVNAPVQDELRPKKERFHIKEWQP